MTFRELGLIAPIVKALDGQGYERPSPIQAKAIPPALTGRDVLGCAQTGTGKTCAFATPILQRLHSRRADGRPIRALILTPTRELAIQIGESFEAYGKFLPLRTAVIFGGVGQGPQVDAIKRGIDILVATPGRLGDLYQQKLLDLSQIEIFVLDEADRMLDMGFIHDVKKILKWLPEKKQTPFFSATMPPEITRLVNSLLHNPARVAVDPISSPVEVIEQRVCFVDRSNKTKLLAHLIRKWDAPSALVFTRTKHGANKVARELAAGGIPAAAIHGNKSQTARQQALADFKAGKIRCLVATDIAARGLDIEDLSHVFNYNLPEVPETYVHRIGRTGRAGKGGVAVALCDFSEKALLRDIEKLTGKTLPVMEDHPWPMEVLEAVVRDKNGKIVNAEDAEARQAARERSRERREAAKARQEAVVPAIPSEETAPPAKKKRRKKKKTGVVEPEKQVAAEEKQREPEPPLRALRDGKPKLVRPGTRFDTGDQMPVVEFDRPDPLAGDRIMDATARLLAPRRPVPAASVTHPPKAEREEGRNRRHRKKKSAAPSPAPKVEQPKQENRKAAAKAQPVPERKTEPLARKKNAGPRRPERSTRSRTKDSTQQKSLMKPYYLSDNNDRD